MAIKKKERKANLSSLQKKLVKRYSPNSQRGAGDSNMKADKKDKLILRLYNALNDAHEKDICFNEKCDTCDLVVEAKKVAEKFIFPTQKKGVKNGRGI